jgi:hypothetical protein
VANEIKMKQQKWHELLDELRTVFAGRNSFLDAVLPPIIFLLVNGLAGFQAAMGSALAVSILIAIGASSENNLCCMLWLASPVLGSRSALHGSSASRRDFFYQASSAEA